MNETTITGLPTIAEEREARLAELRCHRLNLQLAVAHVDFIGLALRNGVISTVGAELMLAELYGTADQAAESGAA